jgi:hypothetical protein
MLDRVSVLRTLSFEMGKARLQHTMLPKEHSWKVG